ncbi:MAG: PEP-CTERM sorting domain-containing protein [Nostoc sp.]|uniref:PEP-CTERM sorting domain-containing protein n=1 Tax=Nostoc sp. TaxID=1180 RepID=UPI002FF17C9A
MRTLSILKTVSAVAAVSAVAITATTGKAGAVTINLGGGLIPSIQSSFNFNNGGISLTATGVINTSPGTRNVYQSIEGLGVSDTNAVGDLNTNQIGGPASVGERLLLTFNQLVNLTSVTFSRVGPGDSFKLLANGSPIASGSIPGGNLLDVGVSPGVSVNGTGINFAFSLGNTGNGYLVRSVTFTAVPEPITIAGMALGSGFGVLLRRKYKKAAKFSNKLST